MTGAEGTQLRRRRGRTAVVAVLFGALVGVSGAPRADRVEAEAPMLLALQGCWEPVDTGLRPPLGGGRRECLSGTTRVVRESAIWDEVAESRMFRVDGRRHRVTEGGCEGKRRVSTSSDGHRVYIRSAATCAGGTKRYVRGAWMLLSDDMLLDIHSVWLGGEHELFVERYRALPDVAPEQPAEEGVRAARAAAAVPLDADDVIDALRHVDADVVEMMLVESGARFAMNSSLVLRLADAGVPADVIDVMVALSFPDHFAVDTRPASRRPAPYAQAGRYGMWLPGYLYGSNNLRPPVIAPSQPRGRVVDGVGYVRVRRVNQLGGSSGGGGGDGDSGFTGSSGSSGSVSSSGATRGTSSTSVRRARRRE